MLEHPCAFSFPFSAYCDEIALLVPILVEAVSDTEAVIIVLSTSCNVEDMSDMLDCDMLDC